MSPIFEADILKEKQRMANQRMNGHFRLNEAIANRQEAESNYQRELYQHQLKLLEIDQENRRRSAEVLSQQEKLAVIEKELDALDFRSPYGGKVRKVKILGQNGRLLNVEILVINPDLNS
jgi:multidrug resistance efflux pump